MANIGPPFEPRFDDPGYPVKFQSPITSSDTLLKPTRGVCFITDGDAGLTVGGVSVTYSVKAGQSMPLIVSAVGAGTTATVIGWW